MKQLLRTFFTLTVVGASALAQLPPSKSPTGLGVSEPFRIERGSSFDASGPRSSALGGSSAERNRILNDFREAEAIIEERYVGDQSVDPETLTRSGVRSMLHSLDPHSNFFDTSEWKEMLDEQQSGYAGIGTSISTFRKDGKFGTFVVSTFSGSPARRAGLQFGDKIIAVDGESMLGRSTDIVRDRIRGSIGTNVRITVERTLSGRVEMVDVHRGTVPQPSIPDHFLLRPGVGYVSLTEGFTYTTYEELTVALRDLHKRGMTSLILDLRGNGGGIVEQAVKVAETFLPAGSLIVSQRGRTASDSREWRSANVMAETMPLVLVVDENTASASEIVAGALQDSDRALIVGEKTFGKGLVQSVIDLPQKMGLTLTAARYYTPSGRSIQRDYSEIGRYDYFSHRGPAADIGKPYFEARTVTGRTVLGGDGICPDEKVDTVELTRAQIEILDGIFYFSRDWYAGRINSLPHLHTEALSPGEHINVGELPEKELLLTAFKSFVQSNKSWNIDEMVLQRESDFIALRIRQSIATAVFGSVAAGQILTEDDPRIVSALKALPPAARLLQAARKAGQHYK
jgi:carboxyl-terminal processing protease